MREKQMSSQINTKLREMPRMFLRSSVLALLIPIALLSGQQSNPSQMAFATPEKAVDALVQASETFDVPTCERFWAPRARI